MPSPSYVYSNYFDWFCPFVGEFLKKKDNSCYYDKSTMYRTKMRENLINFEKKYIELLRTKRPEYFNSEGQPIEGYIAQCATTGNIYKEN